MTTTTLPLTISSCFSSVNHHRHRHRIISVVSINSPRGRTKVLLGRQRVIACEVALTLDDASSSSPSITSAAVAEEEELNRAKIGARVRVKVPLKVYHIPKVPEVDITGMEGELKQYVGLWKGKRISANLPFKIEFLTDIEGRGPVKFFAHLREDEFDYVDHIN